MVGIGKGTSIKMENKVDPKLNADPWEEPKKLAQWVEKLLKMLG